MTSTLYSLYMIDPFAFSRSLREAWVIAKTARERHQVGWRWGENHWLEIDVRGLHLVRFPDKDAPPVKGCAFRRARPEPIHRR